MQSILKLEKPLLGKKVLASFIDAVLFSIVTFILYAFCFMIGFQNLSDYSVYQKYIMEKEVLNNSSVEVYNLNIDDKQDFLIYVEQGKKFYEYYEEEIVDYFIESTKNDSNLSDELKERYHNIQFIYNVSYLGLPSEPTTTNDSSYKNNYFQYKVIDSSIVWNEYGEVNEKDFNARGLAERRQYCYSKYSTLKQLLQICDPMYKESVAKVSYYSSVSLLSAGSISYFIFYILFPLIFPNSATVGKFILGFGYVNTNGIKIRRYKSFIRALLNAPLTLIALYFFNIYTLLLLIMAPYFANLLYLLLNKHEQDIFERVLRMQIIDVKNSLIFKSKEEETSYFNNLKEDVSDEEKEYTLLLNKMKTLDLKSFEEKIADEEKRNADANK